jgi:hypothetical protein
MPPTAFLFRADELRISDFGLILNIIFSRILASDRESKFHVSSGGILLSRFSEKTTAVGRGRLFNSKNVKYTLSDDKTLRAILAVAFGESVGSRHHKLDVQAIPATLLRQSIDCVTVSEMPISSGDAIHEVLRKKLTAYVGYFEIDCGDPLTLELALNGLISYCYYESGLLKWIVPLDQGVDLPADVDWAKGLSFSGVEGTIHPPERVPLTELSDIGRKNAKLLSQRAGPEHAGRVLASLLENTKADEKEFEIKFEKEEFGRANVRKLYDYSLNDQHKKADGTPGNGQPKARLFRQLLGITRDDWLFLGEQLVSALEKAYPNKTRKTDWGIQYDITVPVIGKNGQTKLVCCSWIIRPRESPFLTSAYIAHKADTQENALLANLIVKKSSPDFCKVLFELADKQASTAAKDWSPTPLWVQGYPEAVSEGACGVSWVRIADARRRFARWLKKNDLGYNGHNGGYLVLARSPSQSVERARKYSEEFAKVLRLNGIECEVGWRYD